MIVECIVQNEKDAIEAERLGIDRLELVSAISEGGLTPSYGIIKRVIENVSIPVQVMVRPHSYGFEYDESDWHSIREDLLALQDLGARGIVFGCTKNGEVDQALLEKVIATVPEFDITFHRAFDHLTHQADGLEVLCEYRGHIRRILTSGGKETAVAGREQLQQLMTLSDVWHGPAILIGSGVQPSNIGDLHAFLQGSEYHLGTGFRIDGSFANGLDEAKVRTVLDALKTKSFR
ncbi:copper homeostasis protein CutC [Bacillus testis]|uniref:copper homeostasis protein CutC n=1 Tax=Bacillus testis TaxID=1622072 RepID=UPI00067F1459|nr:copper homeostasis protein CutC [Bacillus testis]